MDDLTLSTPLSFYFLLILVLCIIIFLLCIQPRISKRKVENKNEHGSSKFADIKEIKQTFQKEPLNNIQEGGFPVWYEKKDYQNFIEIIQANGFYEIKMEYTTLNHT